MTLETRQSFTVGRLVAAWCCVQKGSAGRGGSRARQQNLLANASGKKQIITQQMGTCPDSECQYDHMNRRFCLCLFFKFHDIPCEDPEAHPRCETAGNTPYDMGQIGNPFMVWFWKLRSSNGHKQLGSGAYCSLHKGFTQITLWQSAWPLKVLDI